MKKSKFPLKRSLLIKGKRYKVITRKDPVDDDGKPCYGLFDPEAKTITIARGLDDAMKRITLLHELFHAYVYECHVREGLDSQLEEVIAEAFAQAIESEFHIKWK